MKRPLWLICLALTSTASALAEVKLEMNRVSTEGVGEAIGTVAIEQSEAGTVFTPKLSGLSPGAHGFHVHQNGSCEPAKSGGEVTAAGAAGGHFDPADTGKHAGPYGSGHLGDLPVLYARADGSADDPLLAPRLKLEDIRGRALIIHAGGDTYSDEPKLGGGGERIACVVIPKA
jgi:Cu-Zn family superoxide dismutase